MTSLGYYGDNKGTKLVMKGKESEYYYNILKLVLTIDLSRNKLSGEIPNEINKAHSLGYSKLVLECSLVYHSRKYWSHKEFTNIGSLPQPSYWKDPCQLSISNFVDTFEYVIQQFDRKNTDG